MANHPSAVKRHKQSEKKRLRNRVVKASLHTQLKKTRADMSPENISIGQSVLALAGKKGVLYKKTASRRISRLMKAALKSNKTT